MSFLTEVVRDADGVRADGQAAAARLAESGGGARRERPPDVLEGVSGALDGRARVWSRSTWHEPGTGQMPAPAAAQLLKPQRTGMRSSSPGCSNDLRLDAVEVEHADRVAAQDLVRGVVVEARVDDHLLHVLLGPGPRG